MEGKKYTGQMVFGLDIGTRSVVGTVGYKSGDRFIVVAQRVREHETRAMLDGQIHDIQKVGETIRTVKNQLEEAIGHRLEQVCIAAAGRVLRTATTHVEYPFSENREVGAEDVYGLIAAGVEKAYEEFLDRKETDEEEIKFYCVGHSVIRYYLNGYPMGNLEGHKARTIGMDLIATFLPDEVVDGLYKAVEVAGLEVGNLTLEPIAAIQLAIPERFRMLNIALLDVGAGTSDISITNDGCILAYGMIPVAGDALTEVIAKHCLVDFATAEQIKRDCGEKETISYMDIMLLPQTVKSEEIKEITRDLIEDMAAQAAEKIRELNGDKAVSAVFVVGGGGKMPGYTQVLAQKLGIAPERVALRGEEVMQQILFEEDVKKDSLLVTPVGICLNFYEQSNNFIFITFNDVRLKMYDNSHLTVADAAMQAQFPNDGLFPKRGKALNFTVNGKKRMMRGELGEVALITVNGQPADIHTPIHANDVIRVTESTAGAPAQAMISDLPESTEVLSVFVNEQKVEMPRFASVNGELQSGYYDIREGDRVEILNYYTVGQIIEFMDVILEPDRNLYVNSKQADRETPVYENFSVNWTLEESYTGGIPESFADLPDATEAESLNLQSGRTETSQVQRKVQKQQEVQEQQEVQPEYEACHVMVNRESVVLEGKKKYLFVDVFDVIDFDLSRPRGMTIVATINGKPAQYMEEIHDGDVLEIYWEP